MENLKGKIAIVTGAGQGIGEAIATEFAACGAIIAAIDVNQSGLEPRSLYLAQLEERLGPAVSVKPEWNADIPLSMTLHQNYPNPFNPVTAIGYQLSAISNIELSIFNTLGQKVATLVNEIQPAGSYMVNWNAGKYASGIYYYTLTTSSGLVQSRKMLLVK